MASLGQGHVSHSLNSLKVVTQGITEGVIKGDTRSLDYSSHTKEVISEELEGCRASSAIYSFTAQVLHNTTRSLSSKRSPYAPFG